MTTTAPACIVETDANGDLLIPDQLVPGIRTAAAFSVDERCSQIANGPCYDTQADWEELAGNLAELEHAIAIMRMLGLGTEPPPAVQSVDVLAPLARSAAGDAGDRLSDAVDEQKPAAVISALAVLADEHRAFADELECAYNEEET